MALLNHQREFRNIQKSKQVKNRTNNNTSLAGKLRVNPPEIMVVSGESSLSETSQDAYPKDPDPDPDPANLWCFDASDHHDSATVCLQSGA